MTATTQNIDEYGFDSSSDHESPRLVAYEILREVRFPEAIFLQDIAYRSDSGSGTGTFRCPRSSQFPNPDLGELTGGQLIDAATQMAYCLTGLMIHGGVDLLGLDFEEFKKEIHAHRVHAVRTDMAFRHPCQFDRAFAIEAKLQRFPNGRFDVLKRNPRRYFVRIELDGRQDISGQGDAAVNVFRARIAASRPSG